MAHILVRHKFEDYKKWKSAFDSHADFRAENGSLGGKVFRNADDSNEIFVLLEFKDLEAGKIFAHSESLKEAMREAGIVGMPSVSFLEEDSSTAK